MKLKNILLLITPSSPGPEIILPRVAGDNAAIGRAAAAHFAERNYHHVAWFSSTWGSQHEIRFAAFAETFPDAQQWVWGLENSHTDNWTALSKWLRSRTPRGQTPPDESKTPRGQTPPDESKSEQNSAFMQISASYSLIRILCGILTFTIILIGKGFCTIENYCKNSAQDSRFDANLVKINKKTLFYSLFVLALGVCPRFICSRFSPNAR